MGKRTFNFYRYRHNYDVTNMTRESESVRQELLKLRIRSAIYTMIALINYATLKIGLYLKFENKTIDVAKYRGKQNLEKCLFPFLSRPAVKLTYLCLSRVLKRAIKVTGSLPTMKKLYFLILRHHVM